MSFGCIEGGTGLTKFRVLLNDIPALAISHFVRKIMDLTMHAMQLLAFVDSALQKISVPCKVRGSIRFGYGMGIANGACIVDRRVNMDIGYMSAFGGSPLSLRHRTRDISRQISHQVVLKLHVYLPRLVI